ncbi:MAG: C-GCAxxG-C-C family protein, partial [Halobacteriota archaeon]
LFNQGFNCTQAVLSVLADGCGHDKHTAYRIAQGFGAGVSRTNDKCGAVSGAVMVLGLHYGGTRDDDSDAKEKTYAMVADFLQRFKRLHGSIECTDLLGYNLSDPRQHAEAKKIVPVRCPMFVSDAVTLLESVM